MAKKRKLPPKSDAATTNAAAAEAAAAAAAAAEQQEQEQEIQRQQQEIKQEQEDEEEHQIPITDEDLEASADLETEEDPQVKEEEQDDVTEAEQSKDENALDASNAVTESNGAGGEGEEDTNNYDDDDDDEEEPVQKLLEPFTKDQLIEILREAAEGHSDVLDSIRKLSDTDPVHRKIFVHGLGWDTNSESLTEVFKKYGEIEDCNAVCDKITGKSKGYAFILFKHRSGARKALKEPQKKIGSRMTACQLASAGPVPTQAHTHTHTHVPAAAPAVTVSEYTQRKIYVSNVSADIDPQKLVNFFNKFGEIEEGPLGLDKNTGKPKGFALFVYKSIESARKALEEPHKTFEGHVLHCQKAIDGPKPNKSHYSQHQQHSHGGGRPSKFARTDNSGFGGSHASAGTGGHLMAQSAGPGMAYNQGGPSQALNPVLGQALTALLASQGGGGLGLTNLLGTLGTPGVANPVGAPTMNNAMQGGYGNQYAGSGYGSQPGMQGGYSHSQMGQGSAGRSQKGGHMGGVNPYMGH